ncbi:MAG: dihydroorotate dehydrogenase electron transfer subunit [Thermoplasmatota archaeon]
MERILERPRIVPLAWVHQETARHATLAFRDERLAAAPAGSFAMVWVPGVDEVPMGLGYNDPAGQVTLTVEAKGECTRALVALPVGARIGVRGPYGRGFDLPGHPAKVCFVGGGTGIAPMARGAQRAAAQGHQVTLIAGARTRELLLLHPLLEGWAARGVVRYEPCTDDGSYGAHARAPERFAELLGERFGYVAACGPEAMMVAVANQAAAAGVPCEASLERVMKCAIGICDACTVGPGLRLCVEGPVLGAADLAHVSEFGVGHRDASGIMRPWARSS